MPEANPFLDLPEAGNPFLALPVEGHAGVADSGSPNVAGDNPFMGLPIEGDGGNNPFLLAPKVSDAAPRVPFSGLPEGVEPPTARPQEDEGSAVGRVGSAAFEAVRDVFAEPLGMSGETLGPLVSQRPEDARGTMGLVKTFNRALLQGGTQALDLAARSFVAPFMAGFAAIGQTAQELGAAESTARKLVRDLETMFTAAIIVTGNAPLTAGRVPRQRRQRLTREQVFEKADEAGAFDATLSGVSAEGKEAAKATLKDAFTGTADDAVEGFIGSRLGEAKTGPRLPTADLAPEVLVTEVTTAKGRTVIWRGPMDLATFMRSQGGIKDFKGEVAALGVNNAPRKLPFSGGENFLGGLVRKDGLELDEAALRAFEAGYFKERPDINEFLVVLGDTFNGTAARRFRPGDQEVIANLRLTEAAEDFVAQADFFGVDIEGLSDAAAIHKVAEARSLIQGETRLITEAELASAAPIQGELLSPAQKTLLRELEERAPEGALQPWQTNRFEFVSNLSGRLHEEGASPASAVQRAAQLHRESVRKAVDKSLPVSSEVLLDYPDIAGQPARFAGNINLSKVESIEDIKQVLSSVAEQAKGFDEARRGVVSLAQTRALADEMAMTRERLLSRRKGQAFNAEEALAARSLLVKSSEDLVGVAKTAMGGSDEALIAFSRAYTQHAAIQEQIAGITAEAGRALNQFKMTAQSAEARARAIKGLIEGVGGRKRIEDIAAMIAELDTPEKVAAFVRKSRKAKTSDKLLEAWINGLLSGPVTQAVNVTSNSLVAVWTLPEHVVAAGIGAARGGKERVFLSEIPARAYGLVEGAKEGMRLAARTFMTEAPSDLFTKIEARRFQAIPSATLRAGKEKATVRVGGIDVPVPLSGEIQLGGKQVRIPGRLLMAGDELFKAIGYRMELNALAVRQAAKEGLTGRAFAERVEAIKAAPPDAVNFAAIDTARYQTFTRPLGESGQAVQKWANSHPAAKIVLPFVRTMANIIKFSGERSPLGLAMQGVRDSLKAGGVQRDLAISRMAVGTAVGIGTAMLAAEGHITGGGPRNPELRAAKFNTGWKPYSIKIGDEYFSYARLEPLGIILGVSADFAEIAGELQKDESDRIAAMVLVSISKNLTSKSFTRGPSDLAEVASDPDRYGPRYIQRLAGTVVPTGVAQVARVQDPVLREVRSTLDALKSRIPGYSETLPPRRNVWGQAITLDGGLGPDIVSPVFVGRDKHDAVADEVVRLGLKISRVGRKIGGVELTAQQFDDFQVLAGVPAKQVLDRVVADPGYSQLPDGVKKRLFDQEIRKARETARLTMIARHPELVVQSVEQEVRELVPVGR